MTADPNDMTIEGRLDLIADRLETAASVDPGALRKDKTIPAALKRIANAIEEGGANAPIQVQDLPPRVIAFSIQDPENLKTHAGRSTKSFLVWFNGTGRTFQVSNVRASSDADNYTFILFRSASFTDVSTGADTELGTFVCADDGTGAFTVNASSFASSDIPDSTWLIYEHSSGSAESVTIAIEGVFV